MASDYLGEFLTLAAVHLLAVIAPGPDFAVTIRQSVLLGRRAGVGAAIGIGAGISVHVGYTLLGAGALMHAAPWLLHVAGVIGASYLLYLGTSFIRQASIDTAELELAQQGQRTETLRQSFWRGFLTNATNPKATLFFLAVFTTIVSASTPLSIQMLYGGWMCLVNAGWFVLVSLVFTHRSLRQRFLMSRGWIERGMGLLLIGLASTLLWDIAMGELAT
ncbi:MULTISPECIES: LysE family translocator [unclassified Halomonas]|uniref:LysE family translocator n=1 Tax=unclassified Halomonas TaxID=2609666 RepID=UPI001C98C922|nr:MULTISPECIES: LysE family translocator [unclassified Halomonas]MBY5926434.1 LysE family translocator [Halomonas sp. DP4Y7-2]MBY6233476.1 LysE family translocator [Halomonas sp. DP4Y7-1]